MKVKDFTTWMQRTQEAILVIDGYAFHHKSWGEQDIIPLPENSFRYVYLMPDLKKFEAYTAEKDGEIIVISDGPNRYDDDMEVDDE